MWSSMSVDLGMERAALVEVGRVKTVHRMCGGWVSSLTAFDRTCSFGACWRLR